MSEQKEDLFKPVGEAAAEIQNENQGASDGVKLTGAEAVSYTHLDVYKRQV